MNFAEFLYIAFSICRLETPERSPTGARGVPGGGAVVMAPVSPEAADPIGGKRHLYDGAAGCGRSSPSTSLSPLLHDAALRLPTRLLLAPHELAVALAQVVPAEGVGLDLSHRRSGCGAFRRPAGNFGDHPVSNQNGTELLCDARLTVLTSEEEKCRMNPRMSIPAGCFGWLL